jgi:hypothetical protein
MRVHARTLLLVFLLLAKTLKATHWELFQLRQAFGNLPGYYRISPIDFWFGRRETGPGVSLKKLCSRASFSSWLEAV